MTDWNFAGTGPCLLRIDEHCRRWGVGRTRVYEDINRGFYKAFRKGRRCVLVDQISAAQHFGSLPQIQPKPPAPQVAAPAATPETAEPSLKRRVGRPKGSKNRPKAIIPETTANTVAAE
jgi:hypothetical protein